MDPKDIFPTDARAEIGKGLNLLGDKDILGPRRRNFVVEELRPSPAMNPELDSKVQNMGARMIEDEKEEKEVASKTELRPAAHKGADNGHDHGED